MPAPARGASPSRTACLLQVEHDFILQAERETFIEQMKDVMDKAEDMLSEDTDIDRGSDPGMSPPHLSTCGLGTGEVSPGCGVPKGPGLADAPGLPEAAAGHALSGEAARGGGGVSAFSSWKRLSFRGPSGVSRPQCVWQHVLVSRGLLTSDPFPPPGEPPVPSKRPCVSAERYVCLPGPACPPDPPWRRHFHPLSSRVS